MCRGSTSTGRRSSAAARRLARTRRSCAVTRSAGARLSAPPYLMRPPAIIPIDTGRQLFVDDFLIDRTNLRRTFHQPKYHADNPVLKPDRPWEQRDESARTSGLSLNPAAMVFSDGVFFDP